MRILVVEDEPVAAAVLARGLREHSYAVDVAADGAAALERVAANDYDLVILDVLLPGVNGLDVCSRLRAERIAVPVLMLTARGGPDQRVEGLDAGADDYLAKPYHFPELLARVRALLRRGPALASSVLTLQDLTVDTRARGVERSGRDDDLTIALPPLETIPTAQAALLTVTEAADDDDRHRLAVRRVTISPGQVPYVIGVGSPLEPTDEELESLREVLAYVVPIALMLAGVGWFLARQSLSPIAAMAARAGRIGAENVGERLPPGNPRDELGRLAAGSHLRAVLPRRHGASPHRTRRRRRGPGPRACALDRECPRRRRLTDPLVRARHHVHRAPSDSRLS